MLLFLVRHIVNKAIVHAHYLDPVDIKAAKPRADPPATDWVVRCVASQ